MKHGVWFLATSLALGAIKSLLVPVPGPWWVAVAVLAAMVALTTAIAKGMNWARVTFVLLFLLGLPSMFFMRELLLRESQLSLGILAVQTVFQLSATVLLFLPASNIWFRNHGKSSKLTPP